MANIKIFSCYLVLFAWNRLQVAQGEEETVIRSPEITHWGDWGSWDSCATGQFGIGFQIKVEEDQAEGDDTAVNAIKILCAQPRNGRTVESEPTSSTQQWGKWEGKLFCDLGLLTGFQLKVQPPQENGGDNTATNNLRGECTSFGGEKSVITGVGIQWGNWTEFQRCPQGHAICAIKTQIESVMGRGDDTALNNVQMRCCRVPDLSCTPADTWEEVARCENYNGTTSVHCGYQNVTGISRQSGSKDCSANSSSVSLPVVKHFLTSAFGMSKTTGHDWSDDSQLVWSNESHIVASFQVPPGLAHTLYQVVGTCGDIVVHSTKFKMVKTTKPGKPRVDSQPANGGNPMLAESTTEVPESFILDGRFSQHANLARREQGAHVHQKWLYVLCPVGISVLALMAFIVWKKSHASGNRKYAVERNCNAMPEVESL